MREIKVMSDCGNCGRNSYHDAEDPNWICMYCYHGQQATIAKAVSVKIVVEILVPTSYRLEDVSEKAEAVVKHWYQARLPGLIRQLPKLAEMRTDIETQSVIIYPTSKNTGAV